MNAQPARGDPAALKLIELYALPGAGKSSVVDALTNRLRSTTRKDLSRAWAGSSRLRRCAYLGLAVLNYPRVSTALRFGAATRLATAESRFRLLRLVAKTTWLKSQSEVVLLDQGFLQDIWSILLASGASGVDPALVSPLIRSLYDGIDTTIVVLDVDCATASARVASRSHGESRFDRLAGAQLCRSIEDASGLHRQILRAARLAGLPVFFIDGAASLLTVTDQLQALFPDLRAVRSASPSRSPTSDARTFAQGANPVT